MKKWIAGEVRYVFDALVQNFYTRKMLHVKIHSFSALWFGVIGFSNR